MVPYWGPYSDAWDPKRLFLSPNMSQLYVGALPMLAILIFGLGRGLAWTREVRFFSLALIVLIVYALGRYTPLYHVLFDLLPGVNAFRRPADATFLIGGATAILGGYLVHRVASGTLPSLAPLDMAPSRSCLIAAWFAAARRRRDLGRPPPRCARAAREGRRLDRRPAVAARAALRACRHAHPRSPCCWSRR